MPVYTQQILPLDPLYLQDGTYSSRDDRLLAGDVIAEGVVGANDFLVTHVSGLTIQVAAGSAYVKGDNVVDQGVYRQRLVSAVQLSVGAGHATLPRLDQVILRIMDTDLDSSGFREARIEIVPGTPTSGATLGNRSGAADLNALGEASKSLILLADVLVPAAASSITSSNLADKRVRYSISIPGDLTLGSTAKLNIGTDISLSRPAAGELGINAQNVITRTAATDYAFSSRIAADTVGRFAIRTDGRLEWGAGGGAAREATLTRVASNKLEFSGRLKVVNIEMGVGPNGGKDESAITFSNSTAETDVIDQFTTPTNWFVDSNTAILNMYFLYLNNTGASTTFRLRIYFGATLLFDDTTLAFTTGGIDRGGFLHFFMQGRLGTNIRGGGVLTVGPLSAATAGTGDLAANDALNSPFGFDAAPASLGNEQNIRVTITLSSASVNHRFSNLSSIIYII